MSYAVQVESSTNASVNTAAQTGANSTTSLRTVTYWPALAGMGISQSAFTLAPCAIRSPHIHQRAAGLLYAYDGMQLKSHTILWVASYATNADEACYANPAIVRLISGPVIAAADSLEVGFVTENGTAVTNTIASGASAVFPQGTYTIQS